MGPIIQTLKGFCILIIEAVVGTIVGSLLLMMAMTSIYQSPLITLAVAALFTPFHLSDYRRFMKEREWGLIALRFVFLVGISSFLVGLFRLALGYMVFDRVLPAILIFTAPLLFVLIVTYRFFDFFAPNNTAFVRLNRWWGDMVSGGKIYGVFWNS